MAEDFEEAALFTISLLEHRLDRLEYILGGAQEPRESKPKSMLERIQNVENSLQKLTSKSTLISEVQQLLSRHGDLILQPAKDEDPPELGPSERLAMVLTEAPAFPTTASQLKSLTDLPIPPADTFADLAALRPRIEEAKERQHRQAMEISELRKRSGLIVLRWREIWPIGGRRCWNEWSKRMKKAEQVVKRAEFKKAQEDDIPSNVTLVA